METLKYNRDEFIKEFSEELQLDQIIQKLEQNLKAQGRVICKISVNGLGLSEADEARLATTKAGDIQQFEIETEKLNTLLNESIFSLKEFVQQLKDFVIKTSEDLRVGNKADSQREFNQVIANTEWLAGALMSLKSNLFRAGLLGNAEKWQTIETHMVFTLRELTAAYEAHDQILISDILEYELSTSLDKWLELLLPS